MSILDDAIREHLELKRAHGADDAELKKLEDEAFGPPARPDGPDPFAEAPTEFLAAPEGDVASPEPESGRRAPNIADLQEAPPPPPPEAPVEEQPPPTPEPIADSGHSTEERHAIAEQPTEMFDVEGQFEDAATEPEAPSEEQLLDAELTEPRLAPVDPLPGLDADEEEDAGPELEISDQRGDDDFEDDDFFSEQRLSDELNQALEQPLPDEPQLPSAAAPSPPPPAEEPTAVFNLESEADFEEEDSAELPLEEDSGEFATDEEDSGEYEEADSGEFEHEGEEEASDEHPRPEAEEHTEEHPVADAAPGQPAEEHEDVLEDTPDFLEDAPEDDNLWFEQQPPKDFDFDD